ncbi:hypothetical protein IFT90_02150 [Frigoribacterium sp. CFBP 8766]|uniref:hypothetical protein n=1 Tax=Frigoribacterium sp. CFBP 8766 TaxID=2775273 RepID=UPI00178035B7|nr:hypothetical protein [Frigoribacterium sp. CFBP 8766]MBD8583355.1 hypothetical protein [Frigoribacterium sp. CFBP 8766]
MLWLLFGASGSDQAELLHSAPEAVMYEMKSICMLLAAGQTRRLTDWILMNIRRVVVHVAVTGMLATGLAGVGASAATASPAADASEGAVLEAGAPYEVIRERLFAARGSQTVAEMAAIEAMAGPGMSVELLTELDGSTSAAVAVPQRPGTRAITPVGPGCSTTSACITNTSNIHYGYRGTGALKGTWLNVVRLAGGDKSSGLWVGNVNYTAQPYKSRTFARPINADTLTRA